MIIYEIKYIKKVYNSICENKHEKARRARSALFGGSGFGEASLGNGSDCKFQIEFHFSAQIQLWGELSSYVFIFRHFCLDKYNILYFPSEEILRCDECCGCGKGIVDAAEILDYLILIVSEALEKFGCDVSKQVEISREINRFPKSLHQYCSALRVEALSRLQLSIQRLMQMQKSEKLFQI